jgi:hypothetical protein
MHEDETSEALTLRNVQCDVAPAPLQYRVYHYQLNSFTYITSSLLSDSFACNSNNVMYKVTALSYGADV